MKLSGNLQNIRTVETAKGNLMAFADLLEGEKSYNIVIFPKVYGQLKENLEEGKRVELEVRKDESEHGTAYIVLE